MSTLSRRGEVDRRRRVDVLIATELALDGLRDAGDGQSAREPFPLAARHEEIAELDFVARVDHFDFAAVAGRVSGAAVDEGRGRASAGLRRRCRRLRHDRELHVDRVARDVQDRADHAVRGDDGHVRPDVARALVEDHARHAKELGEVLADDLRAPPTSPSRRVLQLQQAPGAGGCSTSALARAERTCSRRPAAVVGTRAARCRCFRPSTSSRRA